LLIKKKENYKMMRKKEPFGFNYEKALKIENSRNGLAIM
jgi:hypothetical protein